jgi:hypothetical protein
MDKTWVYGALRPGDGQAVILTAPSRNSVGYQRLLAAVELADPTGTSVSTRVWLADPWVRGWSSSKAHWPRPTGMATIVQQRCSESVAVS